MFKFHIRGKNGKNRTIMFAVLPGGGFFSTISAVKTVKIKKKMFYRFYRGGAPFSSTISAVKTVKVEEKKYLGVAKVYPLAKQRSRTSLANKASL